MIFRVRILIITKPAVLSSLCNLITVAYVGERRYCNVSFPKRWVSCFAFCSKIGTR
jgi:hypothetical protein